MPVIPIPLSDPDPDVPLDLQQQLTLVYDRAGYDYSLDYQAPLAPPVEPAVREWISSLLAKRP